MENQRGSSLLPTTIPQFEFHVSLYKKRGIMQEQKPKKAQVLSEKTTNFSSHTVVIPPRNAFASWNRYYNINLLQKLQSVFFYGMTPFFFDFYPRTIPFFFGFYPHTIPLFLW